MPASSTHSGRRKASPALAMARMARPFQSASALSSQPGFAAHFAYLEELLQALLKSLLFCPVQERQRIEAVENGLAFPIAALGHVVDLRKDRRLLAIAEYARDLAGGPDVELAFLAFGVRVVGCREAAARHDHVALDPPDCFVDAGLQPVGLRFLPDLGHQLDQERVVVEHLLEMRHEPALIDRIAREAAANMVVDAALANMQKRVLHLLDAGDEAVAEAGFPEEVEDGCVREFGCAAKASIGRVDGADELAGDGAELLLGKLGRGAVVEPRRQPGFEEGRVLLDGLLFVGVDARDVLKHLLEARAAVAWLRREVGAAEKWHAVWQEEHGQGPAALLAKLLQRGHIERIDIGPFLAVDLDVHEQLVHQRRGVRILKALMRHYMTPMASCITHREQHGPVEPLRLRERLLAPGPPMHGVVLVLLEVRACFFAQTVRCHEATFNPMQWRE